MAHAATRPSERRIKYQKQEFQNSFIEGQDRRSTIETPTEGNGQCLPARLNSLSKPQLQALREYDRTPWFSPAKDFRKQHIEVFELFLLTNL